MFAHHSADAPLKQGDDAEASGITGKPIIVIGIVLDGT